MKCLVKLQSKLNVILPKLYLDWHENGGFKNDRFLGTDIDFPALANLNNWANELLIEDGSLYSLPENSFVFSMHQGYFFSFFACDGNPDPEIWSYMEGDNVAKIEWSSFSDFVSGT